MQDMKLNKIRRVVDVCEPTELFPAVYNVDANYQGPEYKLKREDLFDILEKEGLEFSGVSCHIQHGFNDRNAMGIKEAFEAKIKGSSNVWIGLNEVIVNLEILPATLRGLKSETHFEYAQRILEKVVTFVETADNYHA